MREDHLTLYIAVSVSQSLNTHEQLYRCIWGLLDMSLILGFCAGFCMQLIIIRFLS